MNMKQTIHPKHGKFSVQYNQYKGSYLGGSQGVWQYMVYDAAYTSNSPRSTGKRR